MRQYRSGRALITALTILVATRLALTTVTLLGWLVVAEGSATPELQIAAAQVGVGADVVGLLAYLAAIVVFLVWVHRATVNLVALGSSSLRITPAGAVWGFFIPFVNLVQGHQVMATLWTESQPLPLGEHSLRRKTTLVNWWWGLYLFMSVAAWFYPDKIEPGEVRSAALRVCVISLTQLVAGALFLWVVRATQKRQDEQWRDLELRAAMPAPTADVLR
jgi:hypothetical protein